MQPMQGQPMHGNGMVTGIDPLTGAPLSIPAPSEAAMSQLNAELEQAQAMLQHVDQMPMGGQPEELIVDTSYVNDLDWTTSNEGALAALAAAAAVTESPESNDSPMERWGDPLYDQGGVPPARMPYVHPSERAKPSFMRDQERQLLAYAAGSEEAAEYARKVSEAGDQAAGTAAAPEGGEEAAAGGGERTPAKKRRGRRKGRGEDEGGTTPRAGDSNDVDDIGGLEERGRKGGGGGRSRQAGPNSGGGGQNDDDIGGLEYANSQQQAWGGARQVANCNRNGLQRQNIMRNYP